MRRTPRCPPPPRSEPYARPAGAEGERSQASRLIDQVKDKATSQIQAQKERATVGLGSVADAVRQTGRQLRDHQQDGVAEMVEGAAAQLERFSNHLKDRNLDELVGDAQRLARQQPALFIGSSFAAGLLAARFIKASSPSRGERAYGDDRGSDWRDLSSRAGESVYSSAEPSETRASSFESPGTSSSFGTSERPATGEIRDRGGL